ncbi:hypothetical protein MTR67_014652, partial [Solanum verrucosum]
KTTFNQMLPRCFIHGFFWIAVTVICRCSSREERLVKKEFEEITTEAFAPATAIHDFNVLTSGWKQVTTAYGLNPGDDYLFQLVDQRNHILLVYAKSESP